MPDPAALKFLPGLPVLGEGTLELQDPAQAANSPLAQRVFAIPGVSKLLLGADYVTVTKAEEADWKTLKPAILEALTTHFTSGAPAVVAPGSPGGAEDIAARVKAALHRVIDPELGYNIIDLGLVYKIAAAETGTVSIVMTTTTQGCPATNYLVNGVRDSVSGVPGVESVDVQLTYQPAWTPDRMSPGVKERLGVRD